MQQPELHGGSSIPKQKTMHENSRVTVAHGQLVFAENEMEGAGRGRSGADDAQFHGSSSAQQVSYSVPVQPKHHDLLEIEEDDEDHDIQVESSSPT